MGVMLTQLHESIVFTLNTKLFFGASVARNFSNCLIRRHAILVYTPLVNGEYYTTIAGVQNVVCFIIVASEGHRYVKALCIIKDIA